MNLIYEDLARAHTKEQLELAEKRRLAKRARRLARRKQPAWPDRLAA